MSVLEVMALLEAALLLANILAHRKYVQETEEELLMCKAEYYNKGFSSGVEWMKNKRKNGVELPNGANKGEILVKTARILFPDIKPEHIRQVYTDAYAHTVSIEFILPYEEVVERYIPK